MAEFQARCPACGEILRYPESLVGSTGRCPRCNAQFIYPGPLYPSTPPPQSPLPPSPESQTQPPPAEPPPPSSCPSCAAHLPPLPGPWCPFCGASMSGISPVPWDHRREIGFWSALVQTIKQVLFTPTEFFSHMPTSGGLGSPLFFAIVVGTVGGWFAVLYQSLLQYAQFSLVGRHSAPPGFEEIGPVFFIILPLAYAVLMPGLIALSTFIAAAILHLSLMIVRGRGRDFEATYRVVCYSFAANVWLLIPAFGQLATMVWQIVCQIIGLARAHNISTGKSALAVFLPLIACCGCLFLAGIVIAVVVISQLH